MFNYSIDLEDQKPYLDTQGNIIQFIQGSRGQSQLSINNEIFSKVSCHAGVYYWRYYLIFFFIFHEYLYSIGNYMASILCFSFTDVINIRPVIVVLELNIQQRVWKLFHWNIVTDISSVINDVQNRIIKHIFIKHINILDRISLNIKNSLFTLNSNVGLIKCQHR